MRVPAKKMAVWAVSLAMLALGLLSGANAQTCTVMQTGKSEALSAKDIGGLLKNSSIDASISTFHSAGSQYWIFPMVHHEKGMAYVNHVFTKGPPGNLNAKKLGVWDEASLFGDAPGMKWITNTYQDKDGVLAFVHTEYALPGESYGISITPPDGKPTKRPGPGHTRISLAWYSAPALEQRAPKIQFLGHIVAPFDELRFPGWNIHGTPYVIRRENGEDWFYVYYFDAPVPKKGTPGHLATARAKVADVLRDAKLGKVGAWQKFYNGQWTDGLGGKSSPITQEISIAHSDAAQTVDGRFILATTFINKHRKSNKPSAIILFESCDAVTWKEIAREEPISLPEKHANGRPNHGWQYLTIVDPSGADNGQVGSTMELLVGFQHNKPERSLARLLYSFQGNCGCPAN